jgi:ABC-type transport system involved in cytochrome c biogenesis ATPase subunit
MSLIHKYYQEGAVAEPLQWVGHANGLKTTMNKLSRLAFQVNLLMYQPCTLSLIITSKSKKVS